MLLVCCWPFPTEAIATVDAVFRLTKGHLSNVARISWSYYKKTAVVNHGIQVIFEELLVEVDAAFKILNVSLFTFNLMESYIRENL